VELIGKHTDYAGGRSLVAALPRGMALVAAPRDDGQVRVVDARIARIPGIPTPGIGIPGILGGWTRYPAAVARRFAANFPGADLGADLVFASDLPRAAGMSSSSALIIGVALALSVRAGLEHRGEWTASIRDEIDLAGYFSAIENGATFRGLAGGGGVGTLGGSQDHTAILSCRSGRVSLYRYLPVRRLGDEPMPDDWRLVLMTSGVHASKAGAERSAYNRASQAVAALLEIWSRETGRPTSSLAALLDSQPDAAGRLRQWAERGHPDFRRDELARRLGHFVAEDARVPLAALACRDADRQALAELSRASQASAEADLGNQVPETIQLARLALDHGAFAASSFGAGFGGSVWALVHGDASACERMATRWRDAYVASCPHVPGVQWFAAHPGPPAMRLFSAT
jgi:galactokinase